MTKKIISKVINVISALLMIAAVFILLNILLTRQGNVPQVFGYTTLRVVTGSMEPAIAIDSLIVVRDVPAEEIKTGDIISFYSEDPALGGTVNTHRVTAISKTDEKLVFQTQGDANNVPDIYGTDSEHLIGKVIWVSPILGRVLKLVSNPLIFVWCILVPLVIMIGSQILYTAKLTKKLMREEEEKAVREALEELRKTESAKAVQKTDDERVDIGKAGSEKQEETKET